MKISVVIPAFNEEKYIGNCLKSLRQQKKKPYEIIVVDNNCQDKTVEIAKKFNVKIIKEKKQGLIFARNTGFDHAQGDIIARCDADTILPKDWVKKIEENFQIANCQAITGPVNFFEIPFTNYLFVVFYLRLMRKILKHEILVGPNFALSKNIWNKVKNNVCFDDKKVHEDIDLAIHIKQVGGLIRYDFNLIVQASARRILKKPLSFFIEYPIRVIKTITNH